MEKEIKMLQISEEDLREIIDICMICNPISSTRCMYCEQEYCYNYDESMWLDIVEKYSKK